MSATSRTPVTARTPAEAVAYLRELGTGVTASVVLDRRGRVAACSSDDRERAERMGGLATRLLDLATGGARSRDGAVEVSTAGGAVFAARRAGWAVAVVAERVALSSLMLFDLDRLLHDLESFGAAA